MADIFSDQPIEPVLREILHLERIENDIYRGFTPEQPRWGRTYGGQLVAQSIAACTNTINPNTHTIHSFHSYFVRPGEDETPIIYQVTRLKDTKAFITRRVDGIQYGQIIFTCMVQFSAPDINIHTHQRRFNTQSIPHVDDIPSLQSDFFRLSENENLPQRNRQLLYANGKRHVPFDIKWVNREDVEWQNWSDSPIKREPKRTIYMKIKGKIALDTDPSSSNNNDSSSNSNSTTDIPLSELFSNPSSPTTQPKQQQKQQDTTSTSSNTDPHYRIAAAPNAETLSGNLTTDNSSTFMVSNTNTAAMKPSLSALLHSIALSYMSDWGMIAVAMKPHPFPSLSPHVQLASLDHCIHFYSTNIKADEWLIFDITAPSLSNSKATLCGSFYNLDGELVATVQQEALIRIRNIDAVAKYPNFYTHGHNNNVQGKSQGKQPRLQQQQQQDRNTNHSNEGTLSDSHTSLVTSSLTSSSTILATPTTGRMMISSPPASSSLPSNITAPPLERLNSNNAVMPAAKAPRSAQGHRIGPNPLDITTIPEELIYTTARL